MVKIENITRREEDRKLKIKRTKDLLNKFFDDVYITETSSIFVKKDIKSDPFLSISNLDKMILSAQEHYEKTLTFATEYEKRFNVDVTLQTDYSK